MSQAPEEVPSEEEKSPPYTPASPVKRTLAWIAIVYMVILVILTTCIYYTGAALGNLAPLLTVPGLIGAGTVSIVSWRTRQRPGKWPALLIAGLCWILAAITLPLGIAGLLSNFGT